jgi:EAL domain-containing protein (putative c-di-GMP-specific phosphodiesterase class I)/GGDEF domain-containing protein
MVDVLQGRAPRDLFAGRDVVVGPSSTLINDIQHIAGQGWLPGMYFQILGAQTLRQGHPVDRGWLPGWVLMLTFSFALVRSQRPATSRAISAAALGCAAVVPFITDRMFITADYLPGVMLFAIVSYRLRTLRAVRHAETTNLGTDLPNVIALGAEPMARRAPILALRLRNFAAICTSFADDVGDELISAVVHRLTLPGEKVTFYQSESTLFWLAPAIGREEMAAHVEGLARLLQSHFTIRGKHVDLQVAFGIEAQLQRPLAARISGALFAADQARRHNRTFEFFSDSDDKAVESQVTLIAEMEAAIAAGHIWVAYQPQYALADQRLTGFEALVRWNHPAKGPIDTDMFVQAAESMNRIEALTLHILQRVCIEGRAMFEANPELTISVNVSTRLLESGQFAQRAVELVDRMGVARGRITFEITETAGMGDQAATGAMMDELTGYGFKLAIDDYGMGNATLNYLRTVPCDEIKIDRSFITTLTADHSNQLLVKSTIALAHKMGRVVVAEGVEDLRTMQLLRKFGCDIAQGFYLGKPMPIRDALPLSVMPPTKRIESFR